MEMVYCYSATLPTYLYSKPQLLGLYKISLTSLPDDTCTPQIYNGITDKVSIVSSIISSSSVRKQQGSLQSGYD